MKNLNDYAGSAHTSKFLHPATRDKHVKCALKVLEPIKKTFNAIAFCGMSGALIAPMIAKELGKELILVRKTGDKNHSCYKVEGYLNAEKYIIVDDFIDTGATVRHIKKSIKKSSYNNAVCVGFLAVQELKGTESWRKTTKLFNVDNY